MSLRLAIVPIYNLVMVVVKGQGIVPFLYMVAAIVGAGAAYALGRFRRRTWLYLGLCVATAGLAMVAADGIIEAVVVLEPSWLGASAVQADSQSRVFSSVSTPCCSTYPPGS